MRPSVSKTNKTGEFQKKEFDKSPEVKDVDFQSLEIDKDTETNGETLSGKRPLDPRMNNGGYYPGDVPSPLGWRLSTRVTGPPPTAAAGAAD